MGVFLPLFGMMDFILVLSAETETGPVLSGKTSVKQTAGAEVIVQ